MLQNAIKLAFFLLSVEASLNLVKYENHTSCIVTDSVRAINWNSEEGKDGPAGKSAFRKAKLIRNFDSWNGPTGESWKVLSSVDNSTLIDLYPVTDFRWESFLDNFLNVPQKLNQKFPAGSKISFSLASVTVVNTDLTLITYNENEGVLNTSQIHFAEQGQEKEQLVTENHRWVHFRIKAFQQNLSYIYSNTSFYTGRHSEDISLPMNNSKTFSYFMIEFDYDLFDRIKLHDYNFLWTNLSGKLQLLQNEPVEAKFSCIFLFCAMCKNCDMDFELTIRDYNERFSCSSENEKLWNYTLFCSDKLPNTRISLTLFTTSSNVMDSNRFWAIDDIYLMDKHMVRNLMLDPASLRTNTSSDINCNFVDYNDAETTLKVNSDKSNVLYNGQCDENIQEFCPFNPSCIVCCLNDSYGCYELVKTVGVTPESNKDVSKGRLYWLLLVPIVGVIAACIYAYFRWIKPYGSYQELDLLSTHCDLEEVPTIGEDQILTGANYKSYIKAAFIKPISIDLDKQFDACKTFMSDIQDDGLHNNADKNLPLGAVYVKGPFGNKSYISCRSPSKNEEASFWKLIYDEDVTSFADIDTEMYFKKKDQVKYWPEGRSDCKRFDNLSVDFLKLKKFDCFDMYVFNVMRDTETRKIVMLRYLLWPLEDFDQVYPMQVFPFLQKLEQQGCPLLIHSRDPQAAGAVILAHFALYRMSAANAIDMTKILEKIQQQGVLQDSIHYKTAHLLLAEKLLWEECPVSLKQNFKSNIQEQWKYLDEILKRVRSFKWVDEISWPPSDLDKNDEVSLNHLRTERGDVQVENLSGFQNLYKFYATKYPEGKEAFWAFVYEEHIEMLVTLNDKKGSEFWPSPSKHLATYGRITVSYLSREIFRHFSMTKVSIGLDDSQESMKVTLIRLKGWPEGELTPSNVNAFIDTVLYARNIADNATYLVVCSNGFTGCGLFIAFFNLVDQMIYENECNVPLAIRKMRAVRKYYLARTVQIDFLYKCVIKYHEDYFSGERAKSLTS